LLAGNPLRLRRSVVGVNASACRARESCCACWDDPAALHYVQEIHATARRDGALIGFFPAQTVCRSELVVQEGAEGAGGEEDGGVGEAEEDYTGAEGYGGAAAGGFEEAAGGGAGGHEDDEQGQQEDQGALIVEGGGDDVS